MGMDDGRGGRVGRNQRSVQQLAAINIKVRFIDFFIRSKVKIYSRS